MITEPSPAQATAVGWPRWEYTSGPAMLAAYTITSAVEELGLMRRDSWIELSESNTQDPTSRARDLVGELFVKLAQMDIPYSVEADPWGRGGQVIRDLFSMRRTAGTCLDFAIAFAAMCKASRLRPMIAVITAAVPTGGKDDDAKPTTTLQRHALLIVNLRDRPETKLTAQDLAELIDPRLRSPDSPVSRFPQAEEEATLTFDGQNPGSWTPSENWIAVNIVDAARTARGASGSELSRDGLMARFRQACDNGSRWISWAVRGSIVDVCEAHRHGVPELPIPLNRDRLALHTDLPPQGDFTDFPSRDALLADLRDRKGTVVLYGAPGTGKSWLARKIAADAVQGCGWFVDASNGAALTTGLAAREAVETGRDPVAVLESADVKADAERARIRLRTAEGPWVVVLDNADGKPGDLGSLPLPRTDDQLLVVTTTNPEWRDMPGAEVVDVPVLPNADLRGLLGGNVPEQVWRALDGRLLLVEATKRFREQTGMPWWATSPPRGVEGEAPLRIWEAAQAYLGADSESAELARAVSLLPPNRIPVEALKERFPSAPASVAVLGALGLVETEGTTHGVDHELRTVLMHRLFRTAVRHDRQSANTQWPELASGLLHDPGTRELLERAYDPETTEAFHGLLADPARPASDRARDLHLLGRSVERHDPATAGRYLQEVLEDLSWSVRDDPDDVPPGERLLVVDALRTIARPQVREPKTGETREQSVVRLDEAIDLLQTAEALCAAGRSEDAQGVGWSEWDLAEARTHAMHGIALRQYASLFKRSDPARALTLLGAADKLLTESFAAREHLAEGENRHDVDRAHFNLAGLYVGWAQLDAPERASAHLDAAEKVYKEVKESRFARYQTEEFEDVITCVNGLAIVDFYRAVLLDPQPAERLRLLRSAMTNALHAAEIRARLHEAKPDAVPGVDGPDAAKSLALAWKILAARTMVDGIRPERPMLEFLREWLVLPADSWWMVDTDENTAIVAVPKTGTASLAPVPLLETGPDLRARISAWAAGPAMARLVETFGTADEDLAHLRSEEAVCDLVGYLARLDTFTDRWDTRQGRERNAAAELAMTPAQIKIVLDVAKALGLRDAGFPRHAEYDYVLILGGMVRACLTRPRYAAKLIKTGQIKAGAVVALGARRPLSGDEPDLAAQAGLVLPTDVSVGEFEVLDEGTRRAFGLGEPSDVARTESGEPFGGSEIRTYHSSSAGCVIVASAPSRQPSLRRADTADTYFWFAEQLAHLKAGQRVLAITTDIYRTSQHAAAVRQLALPYGVEIDTVGHVPARGEATLRQAFSPTKYLLEVRSTVRALRALAETLDSKD